MSATYPISATGRRAEWPIRVRSWEELTRALNRPLYLPRPIQLHLIRHGETVTNARGLVTGSRDVPLTLRGEEQAAAVGRELDRFYPIAFHSPLERSKRTLLLALASGRTEVGAILPDPRLAERSLGDLEMKPARPVEEFARGDLLYAPSGGDSYAEVARRVLSFLLDLRELAIDAPFESALICSHMGVMRVLVGIAHEYGDPERVLALSFPNSALIRLEWRRLVLPEFLVSIVADILPPTV